MKAANNTLDETIALTAAANTIVQDPEKVGTTLRTVSMYLRAAKTEAEDAGESTEGMADSVSKLRGEILSLTGNKVDIQSDEDTFKSTYQILQELSQIWGQLSDVTQANLLEKLGGKRNANIVSALLENFDIAEQALQTSSDSAGSALQENEKHLESIQGRIDIMKASFQALSATIVDGDVTKFFIEVATAALNLANSIAKVANIFGGLKTVLVAVGGLTLAANLKNISSIFAKLASPITSCVKTLLTFASALKSTGSAAAAFSAAGMGLSSTLFGIVSVLSIAYAGWNAYKNISKQAVDDAKLALNDLNETQGQIGDYENQINELRGSLDSGTLTEQEAYDAKAQLLSIQQELSDSYGSQVDGINLVNGSLEEQIALLDALMQKDSQRFLNENNKGIKKAEKEMSKEREYSLGQIPYDFKEKDRLKDILSQYSPYITLEDNIGIETIFFRGNAEDAYEVLNNLMTDYEQAAEEIGDTEVFPYLKDVAGSKLSKAKEVLEEYQDLADQAAEQRMVADTDLFKSNGKEQTAARWLSDYAKAIEEYNEALQSGDQSQIDETAEKYNDVYKSISDLSTNDNFAKYSDQFDKIGEQLDEAAIKANDFYRALGGEGGNGVDQKFKSALNEIQSSGLTDVDFKVLAASNDNSNVGNAIESIVSAADAAGVSVDYLSGMLVDLGIVTSRPTDGIEELGSALKSFNSIMSETSDTSLSKQIDNFQSDISDIQSITDSINNGEEVNFTDLIQQFPELIGHTNSAADALTALNNIKLDKITGMISGVMSQASEITASDLPKLPETVKQILSDVDLSDVNLDELRARVESGLDIDVNSITDPMREAYSQYKSIIEDFNNLGLSDPNQTLFGNVDVNNRQRLNWTEANLSKYKDALRSWSDEAKNSWMDFAAHTKDTFSTVFGETGNFEGIEIAFSPMLQTENGAVLLSRDTVNDYISQLISDANADGVMTDEELFKLDAEGIEVNGEHVQGIIADIGDTAKQTGEAMQYLGADGAIADSYNAITKIANEAGISVDSLMQALVTMDTMSMDFSEVEIFDTGAFENAIDTQDKLNAAMASSIKSAGMTYDQVQNIASAFQNLDSYNPDKLFERTATGMHLNVDEMRRLQGELQNLNLIDFMQQIADKQREIELANAQGADTSALESQLLTLQALAAQYDSATSAYQRWLDAQSGGEQGDMYDSFQTAIERGDELLNAGLIGTEEFRAIADLFAYGDQSKASPQELAQAYMEAAPQIKKFFTEGQEGARQFVDYLQENNFAEAFMDANGNEKVRFNNISRNEIAKQLGIDVEAVEAIFNKLKDFGFDITFADEFSDQVDEAKEKVKELQETGEISAEVDLEFDTSKMTAKEIKDKISELKGERVKIDAVVSPEAAQALDYLITMCEREYYIKLNAETNGSLERASILVQQLQSKYVTVGVDVESDEEVSAIVTELASLPEEVQIAVGINEENLGNAQGILNQLIQNPESINIPVNFVPGENTATEVPDAEGNANFEVGDHPEEVPDADGKANYKLGIYPKTIPPVVGTANYKLGSYPTTLPTVTQKVVQEVEGGKIQGRYAAGTAITNGLKLSSPTIKGYALGSGNGRKWGLQHDESALVNELAQESIVRDGRFYLIPGGAHVEQLRKGDIVFNGKQTEELLRYGKVLSNGGRGKIALANGTAYSGMSAYASGDLHVNGSGGFWNPNTGKTELGPSSGSSSGAVQNSETLKDNVEDTKKEAEETKQTFDFIEIALSRIENIVNRLKTVASSVYNTFATRNRALAKEIKNTQKELEMQEQARTKYLQEASKVELSPELKKKVREGTFDISEYDEETANLITTYKDLYEKAQNCTVAIGELGVTLSELADEKIQNVIDVWQGRIDKTERQRDHVQNRLNMRTANSSGNYSNRQGIVQSKKNIEDYKELQKLDEKEIEQLKKQRAAVEEEFYKAVKEGTIPKGSQAYNDRMNELHEMDMQIAELQRDAIDCLDKIAEECMSIFDNVVQKYENKIRDLQHNAEYRQGIIDRRTSYASNYLPYEESRKAAQANIKDYNTLIKNAQKQISKRQSEIEAMKSRLKEFVDNGYIEEGDKDYYDMVGQIQEAENEVYALNQQIIDFSNSISEQYSNIFNSIAEEFSNKLSLSQHLTNEYNNLIETAEAKGYLASTKYYEALSEQQEKDIAMLKEEYEQLNEALNKSLASGEIKMGSAEWYRMNQEVNGVAEQLSEANRQLLEFGNTMREIEWDHFDYLRDSISQITDESDFLIDLLDSHQMFEDTGHPTAEGMSVFGLHGVNYNTYMRQADAYADEVEKLQREMAEDPYNTELIQRRDELLEKQRESILAAEEEKEAIRDLVEEGIQIEIDHMKDLIQKYIDAIKSQKDLYDYQKKIRDQVENIAALEKQRTAYQGDDSEEARMKLQKINEQLKKAEENLEEAQYEKYISDITELLNELMDQYQSMMEALLNDLDRIVAGVIDNVNMNADIINDTLQNASSKVGYTMTEAMNTIWQSAAASAEQDRAARTAEATRIIEQLVAEGKLSREDANNLLSALNSGDVNAQERVKNLLDQLVANGELSAEDAKSIIEALSAKSDESKDVLSMYSENFEEKSTTLNEAVDDIEDKVQELIEAADRIAEEQSNLVKEQEEANRLQQEENAKLGEDEGTKGLAEEAVNGLGNDEDNNNGRPTTSENALEETTDELSDYVDDFADQLEGLGEIIPEDEETPNDEYTPKKKPNKNKDKNKSDKTDKVEPSKPQSTGTQGDGKVQIGDQVTFIKGRYYYSSDGLTPTGYQRLGEKVWVGHINNSPWAIKPYALYSNKDLKEEHALGWVSLDQITGYASGAKRIKSDQIAKVGERGTEYIIRSRDGSILAPLAKNDMVLNHAATERIWEMANYPNNFIKDNLKVEKVSMPNGSPAQTNYIQNLENVTFSYPDVKNYDQMLEQMQHDKNFERLISAMTIDRMAGGSSLSKYSAIRSK